MVARSEVTIFLHILGNDPTFVDGNPYQSMERLGETMAYIVRLYADSKT